MIPDQMYTVAEQEYPDRPGQYYMIVVDEGWRQYILCSDMYRDKAEWLAAVLNENGLKPGDYV